MSASENAMSLSMLAGAALAETAFGRCVTVSAENTVILVAATTDIVAGIVGSAPVAIGDVLPVIPLNGARGKVRCGGVVAAGEILVPAADAEVTSVATLALIPADAMGIGIALEAGVQDQLIEAILVPLVGNNT